MNIIDHVSKLRCGGCPVSRRRFLSGCAACAAGVGGATLLGPAGGLAAEQGAKVKIRLVFTFVPSDRPIWPNIGYDFEKRKKEILAVLGRACPEVALVPVDVHNANDAKKVVEADKEVDGYLVFMLGLWTGSPGAIAGAGKPTVFADNLYGGSGEFLIQNAAVRRAGRKVIGVSSSRLEDVARVVKCFGVLKKPGATADDFMAAAEKARREGFGKPGDLACPPDPVKSVGVAECKKRLSESKILCVGRNPGRYGQAIKEVFGIEVLPIQFKELHEVYLKADQEEAAKFADNWIDKAEKMIEPKRDDVVKSGAMYVAMKELLKRHGAGAIAINCLGGFYGGHLQAYPCLGFTQFNDDGLVGACEADLRSTVCMVAMGHMVGRPGFISDPVIDTSKNQIIYAHCVAPTKVFGPAGPSNPCHIRSHSEDRKGAALRSLMPLGRMTTTIEVNVPQKQMIIHRGKTVENIDDDMACRTKLAAEPIGSLDKLMTEWDHWGWHRVTFYGDLQEPVKEICKALGLKLIEEA